jgi:hypothetical protein
MTAARISSSSSLHNGYDDLKILPYRFASKCLTKVDGGQLAEAAMAVCPEIETSPAAAAAAADFLRKTQCGNLILPNATL